MSQGNDEWNVERLIPGGEGFLKLPDGRAAFVPGGMPGDVVRPDRLTKKKSWVRARAWELVRPSPDRVAPGCPHHAICGGCDWMVLPYAKQLEHKAGLLREALTRTGGLSELPDFEVQPSPQALGYRSRLRLHVSDRRLGFHGRGSHKLAAVDSCLVASSELNAALSRVQRVLEREAHALDGVREVELRGGAPRTLLRLVMEDGKGDVDELRRLLPELELVVAGSRADRSWMQRWSLDAKSELAAPAAAFTQVNWAVNRQLIASVVAGAVARELSSFCDLYCGAGNFTLPLLGAGLSGVGVEKSQAAIDAARDQALRQGLEVELHADDVARQARRWAAQRRSWDLLLLDPPRSGARDVLPDALPLTRRWLSMVSCDPVTLARDVRWLLGAGFQLRELQAFDMFPQTHHVETLVWLEKA